MLILPQIKIHKAVELIINILKKDIEAKRNAPEETLLYLLFKNEDNKHDLYNFFEQSLDLFSRKEDHPRLLKAKLSFDEEVNRIPTIYVTLPQDSETASYLGNNQKVYEDNVDYTIKTFSRQFQANINLVFVSDNNLEVILLYEVVRAMLLSLSPHLELQCIQNIKFSGQDVTLNPDLVPPNLFVRTLSLQFQYMVETPVLFNVKAISRMLTATGEMCIDLSEMFSQNLINNDTQSISS